MSLTSAFTPQGQTVLITAAVSPPAPVQVTSNSNYRIINAGTVLAFLGVGSTAAIATANAAVVTTSGPAICLLPGTDEILTFTPNGYFTAATASSTAAIYIVGGEGL